jgi:hypothetical protein
MGDAMVQQYAEQLLKQKNFLALVEITSHSSLPDQVPC